MASKAPTPARADIHSVTLDSAARRVLIAGEGRCVAPVFAPAGEAIACIEQGAGMDRLRVFARDGRVLADFALKGLRAFVWDASGTALYALHLAGRSRGRVARCEIASGEQQEATVVGSVDEASLASSREPGTLWLAGRNPESRITGLFRMQSSGNAGPWSLALRMPGPWSSIAVHPQSGLVHGLLNIEGALRLVNEGQPRSPLELFFSGVDSSAPHYHQLAISPDGALLAFLHGGELHVVSTPGSAVRRLDIPGQTPCGPPVWHPDSQRLACVRDGAIHIVDATTGNSQVLAGVQPADDRQAFSPDGRELVYCRAPD